MENIKEVAMKTLTKSSMKIKKYSPEILFVSGVIGFVGTVILASRETLQADEILEHHKEKMNDIQEAVVVSANNPEQYEYDTSLVTLDRTKVYAETAGRFIKLYAPSVALGVVSIGCFLTSRNIMQKRYLGVVAAYNGLSTIFEEYRKRVIEEQGEVMDRHYMYGTDINQKKITVTDEDGNKKKETITEEHIDKNNIASFSVFFDEGNPNWDNSSPEYNMVYLRGVQSYFTDLLKTRGHVFLNEVYDYLGFAQTQMGAVVGWVYGLGDDYVDFGLYDPETSRRFVNGEENCILLQFNHDGIIWDKI